jgi:hypothetical protein
MNDNTNKICYINALKLQKEIVQKQIDLLVRRMAYLNHIINLHENQLKEKRRQRELFA